VPVGSCERWDPLGVGWDEPDVPVVGPGAGALELLDALEVGSDDELCVGDDELCVGDDELCVGEDEVCVGDDEVCVGVGGVCVGVGELCVGVGELTDGTLVDGTLTDGTLVDGTLVDGSGGSKDSAGGTAIVVIAPNMPAPTDATNNFLPLDTGWYLLGSDRRSPRRHNVGSR
jgi:hypothetical protein